MALGTEWRNFPNLLVCDQELSCWLATGLKVLLLNVRLVTGKATVNLDLGEWDPLVCDTEISQGRAGQLECHFYAGL